MSRHPGKGREFSLPKQDQEHGRGTIPPPTPPEPALGRGSLGGGVLTRTKHIITPQFTGQCGNPGSHSPSLAPLLQLQPQPHLKLSLLWTPAPMLRGVI